MKVLWTSNSPMIESGYGKQTRLFSRSMRKAGHDVVVFGNFGHFGSPLDWEGLKILPASLDGYGRDALEDVTAIHKPDVNVLLYDIFPYDNEALEACKITAYAPVDHDVLPPLVEDRLKHTPYQWAMSKHAEMCMKAAGLTPFYVPHMVDTDEFRPMDRAKARQIVKVAEDVFLVVMVAAHKGFPMRKSFDRVLRAWGAFAKDHPTACLHIQTDPKPSPANNHVDLEQIARFYDVPTNSLRFPSTYRQRSGYFGDDYLNALFNAADVLLSPSMGEGFGVSVIEAQASGCPVIVSDFTAQTELAGPGYKVPVYEDDLWYTLQGAHYCWPRYTEIVKSLEWAYAQRGNEVLRGQSRDFAQGYSCDHVYPTYAEPALQAIGAVQAEARARTEKRLSMRKAVQSDVA